MTSFEVFRIASADERDYPIDGVPTRDSVTIQEAYWTLKESLDDSDSSALVLLTITTSPNEQGVIADNGLNDGTGLLKFLIDERALIGLDPRRTYFRSLKVQLSNGRYSAPRDADAPVRIIAAGVSKASDTTQGFSSIITQGLGGSLIAQGFV